MHKRKHNIPAPIIYWLVYHPWLKIIALILAIMIWFYIRGEINRFNY